MNIMEELFDMQRIYHRAIFDCFSEGLQNRLYSTTLTFEEASAKENKSQQKENWLEKARDWVLDCATILAGIIKDKEDSMMGNIRHMEPEFLQQLREERMYRMITLANMEREKEWGSKRDYELVVQEELTEHVLNHLVQELVVDLEQFKGR